MSTAYDESQREKTLARAQAAKLADGHTLLVLGTHSNILADRWGQYEFYLNLWRHLTSPPETPHINAVRYPAWLKTVEFLEQSLQTFIPDVAIKFSR